ncbi:MAG: sigma-54 dependent transcriptional regulator [Gammaproteobacteria bacterium]|nr:sigma-54 dependent transcriptional regulator [Gammaproteobacteria bacterium]
MKPHILVIDDEPDIRRLVSEILEDEGYAVTVAKDGASARDAIATRTPNLVLLDIWMPDIDGISLLKEFLEVNHLRCPVIMMSGHGTVEAAVESTRLGAFDFIEKPLSLAKLLMTVERALESGESAASQNVIHHDILQPVEMIGKSQVVKKLIEQLDRCARHDVTVLLIGEPGVGKTHCARYIHAAGGRQTAPYVELRTTNLSSRRHKSGIELLLGVESNTGSTRGCLEQASGGTLFIDDVAELDEEMQASLYGVLTSSTVYRIDGDRPIAIDVRIIVATRYDLLQEVRGGRFREDLFHCINAYPLRVPALREHSEDVPELLQYYVHVFSDKERLPYRNFTVAAQNRLRHYHWPGNVLELENIVRRLLMADGDVSVDVRDVDAILEEINVALAGEPGETIVMPQFDLPLRQAREQFEKAYLEYHLKQAHGSVGKVAQLAGIERTHLYRKLRALGIETK